MTKIMVNLSSEESQYLLLYRILNNIDSKSKAINDILHKYIKENKLKIGD